MPRPVVPEPGDLIESAWAGDVIDYTGSKWRYVPLPRTTVANGVAGSATPVAVELTDLPANDPTVKAAQLLPMVRVADTVSKTLTTQDWDGNNVGFNGTSGVASRGGSGPSLMVPVGGTNGRSFKYVTTDSTALVYYYLIGYWVQESDEPVDGETLDPAISGGDPLAPQPGDEVTTDWARSLLARAGRSMRYVPVPRTVVIDANAGTATAKTDVVLPAVVPDDPRVVAVNVDLMIRMSTTANTTLVVWDGDTGYFAGCGYSSGSTSRYATDGPWMVMVGAGRKIKYSQSSSTAYTNCQINVVGYWIAEPEEAS